MKNNNFDCSLIPPSPITVQTPLHIRAAARCAGNATFRLQITDGSSVQHTETYAPNQHESGWQILDTRIDCGGMRGNQTVALQALDGAGNVLGEKTADYSIMDTGHRSTLQVDGAWCGMYHWSEAEGKLWNPVIKQFSADDWRKLVQDMHAVGMNVIILQELFRNEQYHGKHNIPADGYHGLAFYPSELYPGRMDIACADPVEAIMSAADELGMQVLPGIGMYAWFDFTAGSLEWHKKIAAEVWQRYGHHPSFYGWYISEEVFGDLHYGERTEENIIEFFREFKKWKNAITPAKPVMLAPNCFYVRTGEAAWRELARELDIICPFAFHRMEAADDTPEATIALLQDIADSGGAHFWMDMESFLFNPDMSLYPRPVADMIKELERFPEFEKILCYQFPGLMNSPQARLQPGGPATMDNFINYKKYLTDKKTNPR